MGIPGRYLTQNEKLKRRPAVMRLRDSHHMVARLFALGLRPNQVALVSGYGPMRVSQFANDPAFMELIAQYRKDKHVTDGIGLGPLDNMREIAIQNALKSVRHISDHIDEADANGELLPVREALAIFADAADRVGLGKKQTNINVNIDFASQLDRAIKRSGKTVEAATFHPIEGQQVGALASPADPAPLPVGLHPTELPHLEAVGATPTRSLSRVPEVIDASGVVARSDPGAGRVVEEGRDDRGYGSPPPRLKRRA